jgi:hypothetical protein
MSSHGSPVALLKLQIAPKLMLLISSGSKKKEPRCMCLSEARASHSQRICAEVSSATPHLLHSGLSANFGVKLPEVGLHDYKTCRSNKRIYFYVLKVHSLV